MVSSPDADVFVLLLPSALTAHHQQRGNQIFFRTGVKEKYRGLKMEHFVSKLNESHVRGMIGFHSFTGDEVNCFEMLGQDNLISHNMDTLNDGLSNFLMKAYATQSIAAANIGELRWQLFSKKHQLTSDKLVTTSYNRSI